MSHFGTAVSGQKMVELATPRWHRLANEFVTLETRMEMFTLRLACAPEWDGECITSSQVVQGCLQATDPEFRRAARNDPGTFCIRRAMSLGSQRGRGSLMVPPAGIVRRCQNDVVRLCDLVPELRSESDFIVRSVTRGD
jgi:hypothetical protein